MEKNGENMQKEQGGPLWLATDKVQSFFPFLSLIKKFIDIWNKTFNSFSSIRLDTQDVTFLA